MPQRQITGKITARENAQAIAGVYVDVILTEMQPYPHTRTLGRALTDARGRYDLTVDLPNDVPLRGRNAATIHLNVHDNISHSTLSPSYELGDSAVVIDMVVTQDITLLNDWADFRAQTAPAREGAWMADARDAHSPVQAQAFLNSTVQANSSLRNRGDARILNRGGATPLKKPCCDDCGEGRAPCSDGAENDRQNSGIAAMYRESDDSSAWANLSDGGWMRDALETPGLDYGPSVAKGPNFKPNPSLRDDRRPIPWGRSWADQLEDGPGGNNWPLGDPYGKSPLLKDKGKTGCGRIFYLDAVAGDDAHKMCDSPNTAWKTLWQLHVYLRTTQPDGTQGIYLGDEFVFAPGEYNNEVAAGGEQSAIFATDPFAKSTLGKKFFVFQASFHRYIKTCDGPILFRAAADASGPLGKVTWRGIIPPSVWAKEANTNVLFPFRFVAIVQEPAQAEVALHIENIDFIGRGGGDSGLHPNWRAPKFMLIDSIGSLIMRNCYVGGSADAPDGGPNKQFPDAPQPGLDWQEFLPAKSATGTPVSNPGFDPKTLNCWTIYHKLDDVYGLVSTGPDGWRNLHIDNVHKGDVTGCTFEAISNVKKCGDANPKWRFPPNASYSETVEMLGCSKFTYSGCTFGSAGHFALQLRDCTGIVVQDSTIWNRVHSGISGEQSTNCTFERNTFVLGGAWHDAARASGLSDNYAMTTGGSGHIIAFNFFKPDPDAEHGGDDPTNPRYVGDFGIVVQASKAQPVSKIAIFNNTLVDVAKSALWLYGPSAPKKLADPPDTSILRDILVFNNIILGQRYDPTKQFLESSFNEAGKTIYGKDNVVIKSGQGPDANLNTPLPHEPSESELLLDSSPALLDIHVAGVYDGSSGIRLFCNAIGRRQNDLRQIDAADWAHQYPKANMYGMAGLFFGKQPANVLELLTLMANGFFASLGNLPDLSSKVEIPHWAEWIELNVLKEQYIPQMGAPYNADAHWPSNGNDWYLKLNQSDLFFTDWAIKLPGTFNSNKVSYRWASVNDLNWKFAAAKLANWGPLGGENTSTNPQWATLQIDDDAAPSVGDFGQGLPMTIQPWLPADIPPFELASSVHATLPASIPDSNFKDTVENYLGAAADLHGHKMAAWQAFKGAVLPDDFEIMIKYK